MPRRKVNLAQQLNAAAKLAADNAAVENTKDAKTSRQQVSKIIKINLSVSRVRKILDKENINLDIEQAIANLRDNKENQTALTENTQSLVQRAYADVYEPRKSQYDKLVAMLKAKKTAESRKRLKELALFPDRTNTVDEQVELVSKLRHRFSNDSSVALTSVLDYVVQDLARVAIVNAKAVYKSIIKVEHVLYNKLADSTVLPLLNNLPCIQNNLAEPPAEDNEEEEAYTGPSFDFYVHEICKQVRAELIEEDEKYKTIRISKDIRQFGSQVVVELIERLSPLISLYVQNTKVKTINDNVIKFVVQFLFVDAKVDCTKLFTFVNEKLELYRHRKDAPAEQNA